MSTAITVLALIATFYQLYLQRVHNEKSLKPLIQIDLGDLENKIYVHVINKGVGPLIIDKLTFITDGKESSEIKDCLELDPRSYMHITKENDLNKTLLPGSVVEIFNTVFEKHDSEENKEDIRSQLATIILKVEYRDIYNNKFNFEKGFEWFSRYSQTRKASKNSV